VYRVNVECPDGNGKGGGREGEGVGGDNAWKTGRLLDDKVSTNVY